MADSAFHSPFAEHSTCERPGRDGQIQVRLHAHTLPSVTVISTWPSGTAALCSALGRAFGATDMFPLPPLTGQTAPCPMGLLLRTGPHEFMLIGDAANDQASVMRRHVACDVGSVLDLSHARVRVQVQGHKALECLGKLFALDFRDHAFPVGSLQLSGHHHVPCSLHRLAEDRFDLYVLSTYAHGQLEALMDAALEYGVALTLGP